MLNPFAKTIYNEKLEALSDSKATNKDFCCNTKSGEIDKLNVKLQRHPVVDAKILI